MHREVSTSDIEDISAGLTFIKQVRRSVLLLLHCDQYVYFLVTISALQWCWLLAETSIWSLGCICFVRHHQTRSSFHQLVSSLSATEPFRFQLLASGTDCRHTSHCRRRYTFKLQKTPFEDISFLPKFSLRRFAVDIGLTNNYRHCISVHVEHLLFLFSVIVQTSSACRESAAYSAAE